MNSLCKTARATGIAIFAGVIYAISLKYFVIPTGIILPGTEGLALASSYFWESEGLFILLYSLFQALLLLFSFRKIGRNFSLKTLITLVSIIVLLLVLPPLAIASPEPENERLVLVLFGGIIAGIGKAVSLINRGSTGDEDIISVYYSEKLRTPVGNISIIAGVFSMLYGLTLAYIKYNDVAILGNTLIYTIIFIFVSATTVNVIYKRYRFSGITINTDQPESITAVINRILPERTFTRTACIGGYSNMPRTLITLIVTQEELPEIIEQIAQLEGNYFLYHYEIDAVQGNFAYEPIR